MDLKGLADEANLNLLGNIYMDQAQPQLALLAYKRAMEKAAAFQPAQAIKSVRIMNDFGHPEAANELARKIRSTGGANLTPADALQLSLTEVKIARAMKQTNTAGQILAKLAAEQPANPQVMLESARHFDILAREEQDEDLRKSHLVEAKTNYMLAIENEATAYDANLAYGQMLVRDSRALDALPFIEKALVLKKSESLEQYTARVRRAADREKIRNEREQAMRDQAAKEEAARKAEADLKKTK
jgi:hypothetical protein